MWGGIKLRYLCWRRRFRGFALEMLSLKLVWEGDDYWLSHRPENRVALAREDGWHRQVSQHEETTSIVMMDKGTSTVVGR